MLDSNNKEISLLHEKAEWYHRLKRQEQLRFVDIGNADDPHLYFDIKLFDENRNFLGFFGVGVDLNHFADKFTEYSERFGFELIFSNHNNNVMISSNRFDENRESS